MSVFYLLRSFIFASIALVGANALNILQIAPNFLESNYLLSVDFAFILSHKGGHHVHFMVPLSAPSTNAGVKFENVRQQYCFLSPQTEKLVKQPPPDSLFINPPPEEVQTGGWTERHYKQSPAIAFVEGFKVISNIYRNKECWEEISKKKFDVGLMDVWDFGALALFHKLGIKNVVLLHNMPLMSHMYDWMGEAEWPTESGEVLDYKRQILENGVPELFSSIINNEKLGESGAFTKEHKESVDIFTKVYEIADHKFNKLFNPSGMTDDDENKMLSLKELFGRAKFLFVNSMPSLDYNLGNLPKKVKFVGGIDLMSPRSNDIIVNDDEEGSKVILFSMGSLIDPAKMPDDKFETVVKGLGMVGAGNVGMRVIWKYAKKEECDDQEELERILKNYGDKEQRDAYLKECEKQKERDAFIKEHAPNVRLVEEYYPGNIAHKNTAMVISACDIRGAMDTLKAKKPLLCMPMFADHFYVAEKLRREGAAVVVDPRDQTKFSPEAFAESIRKCINLPKQANNPWERNVFTFENEDHLENLVLNAFKEIEEKNGNDE